MADLAAAFAQAGVNHAQLAQFLANHGHGGALQEVTKTVHRDGKTFQQTFHVGDHTKPGEKPSSASAPATKAKRVKKVAATTGDGGSATTKEAKTPKSSARQKAVKEDVAKGDTDAAIKTAGGDPHKVNQMVNDWADHGGSEGALRLRGAIAKAAGVRIDDAAVERMANNHQHFKSEYEGEKISHEDAKAAVVKHTAATDDDVKQAKAAAEVSQAAYSGTHVDLYRGITGAQAQQIKEAIGRGETKIKIAVDGVTSWTDKHSSAASFAKGQGGQGSTSSSGVVIKSSVPVKSIVLSHKSFKQLAGEDEVAIASHGMIEINASDISFH